jgi:glutaredoxin
MNRPRLLLKLTRFFLPAKTRVTGVVVEIYSKPDCHLCEEAKAVLAEMQQRHGFQLREVNIANDPALLAEYGTRIPLIFVDGHLVGKYFVDEAAMVKRLRLAVGEKPA